MVDMVQRVGNEFRVNTYTTGDQWIPVIATLNDGGFVIAWTSYGQDGSDYGVYAQRYDASGDAVDGEFPVNTTTANNQWIPSIAALKDGGFVVTWQSEGQDGSSTGVYGRRYDASGAAASGEFRVNTTTQSNQEWAAVTALKDGGFVVTWQSNNQDVIGTWGIYAQAYNANGSPRGGEFLVNTHTANSQDYPAITALTDGGYVITWGSGGLDGSNWGIFAQAWNANGTPRGAEFQVNTYTTGSQTFSQVAALQDGGFVVTWTSFDQDGDSWGIFAQAYNADRTPRGGEFPVNTYTDSDQSVPRIAALSDGGYIITWRSFGQDGSGQGVYAQAYDADGTARGAEFRVNTHTMNDQMRGTIAALDDGFVATWYSQDQDGSGYGVYAQIFSVQPNTAPVGVADGYATDEDTVLVVPAVDGVLANDIDGEDDGLSAVMVMGPAHGDLTLHADGSFTYMPDADYHGPDSFTYKANDGTADSAPVTVSLTVNPVNDAPTAPESGGATTDEDVATGLIAIGASDVDGDVLAYSIKAGFGPAKGGVTFSDGGFRYTPNPYATGSDSFTILIEDGNGGSAEQVVSVTINPIYRPPPPNSAPEAGDDNVRATEDRTATYSFPSLLANDRDPDGDWLTIIGVSNASNGFVRLSGEQVMFTPRADFFGVAGFDYTVSDGRGGTDTAHVTVHVAAAEDAPVLPAIAPLTTIADIGIVFVAQGRDADGDPLTYAASTPAHGRVTVAPGGRITYTPDAGFVGQDSFMLDVSDGRGGMASQSVDVSVVALDARPDWRLFAGSGFAGEISGGGMVFGTNGFEAVTILDAPGLTTFDASFNRGDDVIRLVGDAGGWRVALSGSTAIFSDDNSFVSVPIGVEGVTVAFDDGPLTLRYAAADGKALIGAQAIGGALEPIATLPFGQIPDHVDPEAAARLLLANDAAVTAGGDLTVFGANGAETLHITRGKIMLDASFNRGGDRVVLDEAAGVFTATRLGSIVRLDGDEVDLMLPVGVAGTTIAFADGERTLRYDPELDAVLIGAQPIGLSPVAITDFA